MSLLLQLRHFRSKCGSYSQGFARNDANCTARNDGTAQMYIKELWNLPIASILIGFVYFMAIFCTVPLRVAAVDNQTDSQQFLLPIIMPLMFMLGFGYQ
jgi:membrane protein insertase Oxa1/YidC/SpoIIIJ